MFFKAKIVYNRLWYLFQKERENESMEKLMMIDGNSIANRAFYGVPLLTNAEGKYTNAIYGFLNILFKLLSVVILL